MVVEVQAPAGTPDTARLWLAGDLPALGRWNGAGLPLERLGRGWHRATLTGAEGTRGEFKVTRGAWETVEKGPHGEELANRPLTLHDGDTVRVRVAAWRDQVGDGPPRPSTRTGDIRTLAGFAAAGVAARDVWVWLPPGWAADSLARWPVVYLLDGQNVFDAATSFIGVEWGADETMARGIAERRVAPAILVAVANTSGRIREYTRTSDPEHGGGGSLKFARFLGVLKREIELRFRGDPSPGRNAIVGSSLGGLCALDAGLDPESPFGLVGCLSPSVWWDGGAIVRRAGAPGLAHPRIWLDMGGEEGTPGASGRKPWLEDSRRLRDALASRGWREGADLHYEEVAGARHDERAWSARLGRVLAWLLPPGS